jgi:hypothetical protein
LIYSKKKQLLFGGGFGQLEVILDIYNLYKMALVFEDFQILYPPSQ